MESKAPEFREQVIVLSVALVVMAAMSVMYLLKAPI